MKIMVALNNSFKDSELSLLNNVTGKEMSAEEILQILVSVPVPIMIAGGDENKLFIDHPHSF